MKNSGKKNSYAEAIGAALDAKHSKKKTQPKINAQKKYKNTKFTTEDSLQTGGTLSTTGSQLVGSAIYSPNKLNDPLYYQPISTASSTSQTLTFTIPYTGATTYYPNPVYTVPMQPLEIKINWALDGWKKIDFGHIYNGKPKCKRKVSM